MPDGQEAATGYRSKPSLQDSNATFKITPIIRSGHIHLALLWNFQSIFSDSLYLQSLLKLRSGILDCVLLLIA